MTAEVGGNAITRGKVWESPGLKAPPPKENLIPRDTVSWALQGSWQGTCLSQECRALQEAPKFWLPTGYLWYIPSFPSPDAVDQSGVNIV